MDVEKFFSGHCLRVPPLDRPAFATLVTTTVMSVADPPNRTPGGQLAPGNPNQLVTHENTYLDVKLFCHLSDIADARSAPPANRHAGHHKLSCASVCQYATRQPCSLAVACWPSSACQKPLLHAALHPGSAALETMLCPCMDVSIAGLPLLLRGCPVWSTQNRPAGKTPQG